MNFDVLGAVDKLRSSAGVARAHLLPDCQRGSLNAEWLSHVMSRLFDLGSRAKSMMAMMRKVFLLPSVSMEHFLSNFDISTRRIFINKP